MKFIISENEKNRILNMHKEATKKHYLFEQKSRSLPFQEGTKRVTDFIRRTFSLGNHYPGGITEWKKLSEEEKTRKYQEASEILSRDYNKDETVRMAKNAGLQEDEIKLFQKDLLRLAGHDSAKFKSGNEWKDFVDGKLGTNTIKMFLDYQINQAMKYKKTGGAPPVYNKKGPKLTPDTYQED